MESTNELLENIIKRSIKNVICIDDGFIEPYSDTENNVEAREFSKAMYEGISNECQCSVTIIQYNGEEKEELIQEKLDNKDLLILDWELTIEGRMEDPVRILDYALSKNIPYICVYTNATDVEGIGKSLERYYSGYDKGKVEKIIEDWENQGIIKEQFEEEVKQCFEVTNNPQNLIKKVEKLELDIDKNICNYRNKKDWYPIYLKWGRFLLPTEAKYIAKKVDEQDTVLNIDGKIIFVFAKNGSGAKSNKIVSPNEIVSAIAENIILRPNSIMDCIWLQYVNCYQDAIYKRKKYFGDISYKAFAFHVGKMIESEEASLDDFLKEIFNEELMDVLNAQDISVHDVIKNKIFEESKKIESGEILKDLVRLNERLTVNRCYSEHKHKIAFGDVFFCKDAENDMCEYWLCITAKCDCARPENKIRNNYVFIGGKHVNERVALKKAETDYYSFINTLETNKENPICIQWCSKINSIYIIKNIVTRGDEIVGNIMGNDKNFIYLGNVKENFAQRMANMAFSDGNRVGVSLAKL